MTEVNSDLLVSGQLAGRRDRNKEVRFPDPTEAIKIDGFRTVPLERLIALKLVTWRFRDWADVMALIQANGLEKSFAEMLPEGIRRLYLLCYNQLLEEAAYEWESSHTRGVQEL